MPLNHHSVSRRKNMNIELHLIQNFAPSNLNRSDTGTPKECEFGGVRRARVSSQCFKRAIRTQSRFAELLIERGSGKRTRQLIVEIARKVDGVTDNEKPSEKSVKVIAEVFKEGGIERREDNKKEDAEKDITKLVIFMDATAIDRMAALFKERWANLTDKKTKEETIEKLGKILVSSVKSPDIAMFGRMLEIKGEKPFGKRQLNVDAACQVAHAISTHKVGVEFDSYTAVDDLLPTGETGAGMMGTVEFNSACFYRYANIDVKQLTENLGNDADLAHATIEAFLRSMIHAIPTGKQNSMAAQNLPSFVLAVVRPHGFWSLANAFVNPIKGANIVNDSIKELDKYWGQLATVYGGEGLSKAYVNLSGEDLPNLNGARQASINDLVTATLAAVKKGA
jgi:CRISPR system Cascade subunit CasC